MRVWVTRAQPGAGETAGRLKGLGYDPVVAPLLDVQALALPELDLDDVGAFAFTSANAVRCFSLGLRCLNTPVFTVGDATAAAAQAAGYSTIVSAHGEVADLAKFLIEHREDLAGPLLHPSATEPAGDLVGELCAAGVSAKAVAVYETCPVKAWPDAVRDGLANGDIAVVLIHSPKAARAFAKLSKQGEMMGLHIPLAGLSVFTLSPACAAPLNALDLADVEVADAPEEAALLRRLIHRFPPPDPSVVVDADRPKPVFTRLYFALMALSLACVLAGAWIGLGQARRNAVPSGQDAPLAIRSTPGK